MYQTGSGVPQDLVAAYKWYSIAASLMSNSTEPGRNYPGRNRDRIAGHLAPDAACPGATLARQWRPKRKTARRTGAGVGDSDIPGGGAERRKRVANIQRILAELGYDPGPADGVMGPRTRRYSGVSNHHRFTCRRPRVERPAGRIDCRHSR